MGESPVHKLTQAPPLLPFGLLARKPAGRQPRPSSKADKQKQQQQHAPAQKCELLWASAFGPRQKRQRKGQEGQEAAEPAEPDAADVLMVAGTGGDSSEEDPTRMASSSSCAPSSSRPEGRGSRKRESREPGDPDLQEAMRPEARLELLAAEQVLSVPLDLELQEEAREQEMEAASAASRAPPAPAARPARLVRVIGICGFDVAPSRGQGSKCYFCNMAIAKGSVRFDYQFSESGKMSRYIHPECCSMIPEKGRLNSVTFLRGHTDSTVAGNQVKTAISVLECM